MRLGIAGAVHCNIRGQSRIIEFSTEAESFGSRTHGAAGSKFRGDHSPTHDNGILGAVCICS